MRKITKKNKLIIGRSDLIDLPDLNVFNLKAKVDTGAFTCSIHCENVRVIGRGRKKLLFCIPCSGVLNSSKTFRTTEFSEKKVKNSFGQTETRYVINTHVLVFNKLVKTEFTLSNRSNMKHPVLLGRKFLKEGFIVDVSRYNLSFFHKRKTRDGGGEELKSLK